MQSSHTQAADMLLSSAYASEIEAKLRQLIRERGPTKTC